MVKGQNMLISEFARRTGLTPDTVRFYIRKGLITPEMGRKGGSNPYQIFAAAQIAQADAIRLSKALGFSLKEIAAMIPAYLSGDMTAPQKAEILRDQLGRLSHQARQIAAMTMFLRAKLDWTLAGSTGKGPVLVWPDPPASLATG